MSLSRPANFPLLKLPWLCIKDVVKSCDIFDIIFLAAISKKTRRIVKSFKIPLTGIKLPRTNDAFNSYSDENELIASKMVMEFLSDVFKCSIELVSIDKLNIPVSGDVGVKSTENLCINQNSSLGYAQSQKLNSLLENMEVTGRCDFLGTKTEKGFYVDPKLFKCQQLVFWSGSAAWVTREILMQFEVPRLSFHDCPFSVEDIVSFVTNWFHSYNKKLEYLCIESCGQISSEDFQTQKLNPVPFSKRNRIPPINRIEFVSIDFSKGLEIVRHDGLQATIHVGMTDFMFYIWHNQ